MNGNKHIEKNKKFELYNENHAEKYDIKLRPKTEPEKVFNFSDDEEAEA